MSSFIKSFGFVFRLGVFVSLVVSIGALAHAQGAGKNPVNKSSVDEISDYFIEVVFGDEYAALSSKPKVISKWSGIIGISLQGRTNKKLAALASKHLNYLSNITKLRFKQVKPSDPMQSINIIFLKKEEMFAIKGAGIDPRVVKKLAQSGGCYFMAFHKPPRRIVKAIIAVNIERPMGLTDSCILEEITQSLGLPNDSNNLRPSIFSDLDHETKLSRNDEIIVRTLYDPRMIAGTNETQARAKAIEVISELNISIP